MTWIRNRANKYSSTKVFHDGYSFSSKLERALYDYLVNLRLGGEISDIQVQDHVKMTAAKILYIADFKIFNISNNQNEWYESKGFKTTEWALKRRLWMHYGPGPLHIFGGSYSRLKHIETIIPSPFSCECSLSTNDP